MKKKITRDNFINDVLERILYIKQEKQSLNEIKIELNNLENEIEEIIIIINLSIEEGRNLLRIVRENMGEI